MSNKIRIYENAIEWINTHSVNRMGIAVTSKQKEIYPEVTGYYINTLLVWGEKELAKSYAKYLCSIQKEDGAWCDPHGSEPYVFDSAQILKGLVGIYSIMPEVKESILKGCNWIIGNINEEGRLITPSHDAWGNDEKFCSELVHLYCLTPLMEAAKIFNKPEYKAKAIKVKNFYINNYKEKILHFSLLSHFYAYVMEGLIDLGEESIVREAMNNIKAYQNRKGGIPGLKDVKWVCSTGMFQLALVWYKLGELEEGNKIFSYACSLQNESGGWYGSYSYSVFDKYARGRKKAYYFPKEEISWANKYFLDALAYKEKLEFEKIHHIFSDKIDMNDGRYCLVEDKIKYEMQKRGTTISVCDIGCGRGRYLNNLIKKLPENTYYASDLSEQVMSSINSKVEKVVGRLTDIPYKDNSFEFVYVCEALEHAINIEGAYSEIWRITKPEGCFLIIDKPLEKLGQLEIDEWEQWIDDGDIKRLTQQYGGTLEIIKSVPYEEKDDGLFRAWIIRKSSD